MGSGARSPRAQAPPSAGSTSVGGGAQLHNLFVVAPPTNLTSTNDNSVCGQHGGVGAGLACKALLPLGRLALVWDYPSQARILGYRVYRVDAGQKVRIYDQSAGAGARFYVVDPPPSDGYAGACYAVSAYSETEESALSAPFCGAQARLTQTVALAPAATLDVYRFRSSVSSSVAEHNDDATATTPNAAVGFSYTTGKSIGGDQATSTVYRYGMLFDATPVMHRKIVSAKLSFEVESAWRGDSNMTPMTDAPTGHDHSCADVVAEGVAKWWKYTDWIDASPVKSAAAQGPDIALDVTDIVDGWANYAKPNLGLVLIGEEENLKAFTEKSCVSTYSQDSFRLTITYY